ncbi:MAG TPA: hypothetical protein VF598_14975 [Hymenobacter sp.]
MEQVPYTVLMPDAVNTRNEFHLPLMSEVLRLLRQTDLANGVHIVRPQVYVFQPYHPLDKLANSCLSQWFCREHKGQLPSLTTE